MLAAPAIVTAAKTDSQTIVGSGDHRYEAIHNWPQLPSKFTWQTTHDVAVDRDGLVYIIHQGLVEQPDHPSIFVFDPAGKYVRSFGQQFQGGGHGLEVRDESGQEFLYVCAYKTKKVFAKLDLNGKVVWTKHAPMESGVYADGEDTRADSEGGRTNFLPTNIAFPPDGGFLVADGYGSFFIHHYDDGGKWQSCFGGSGEGDGKFDTPHGLWIDARPGREPQIVVTDRVRGKLKWFTLGGQHRETLDGFVLPANIDVRGDVLLVPDLAARVTLLDKDNRLIAHLGEDPVWRADVMKMEMRTQPERWEAGRFVHPHDACFDHEGNILVAEWVDPGRVTMLKRL
jgi:hypothetical protein